MSASVRSVHRCPPASVITQPQARCFVVDRTLKRMVIPTFKSTLLMGTHYDVATPLSEGGNGNPAKLLIRLNIERAELHIDDHPMRLYMKATDRDSPQYCRHQARRRRDGRKDRGHG
jgi:hypothetical protein